MDTQRKAVSLIGKVKNGENLEFDFVLLDKIYLPIALVVFHSRFDSRPKRAVVHLADNKFLNPMYIAGMSKGRMDFLESSIPAITKVLVEEDYLSESYLS